MRTSRSLLCIGVMILALGLAGSAVAQNSSTHRNKPVKPYTGWTPVTTPIETAAEKDAAARPPVMVDETVKNSEPGFGPAQDTRNKKPVFLHWALVTFEPKAADEEPGPMALRAAGSSSSVSEFVKNIGQHAVTAILDQGEQDVYPSIPTPFGVQEVRHNLPASTLRTSVMNGKKTIVSKKVVVSGVVVDADTLKKGSGPDEVDEKQKALNSYLDSFRKDPQTPESLAATQFEKSAGHVTLVRPSSLANLGDTVLASIDWSLTRSDTTAYAGVWALPQTTTQSIQSNAILPVNRVSVVAVMVITDKSSLASALFSKKLADENGESATRYLALIFVPMENAENTMPITKDSAKPVVLKKATKAKLVKSQKPSTT